MSDPMEFPPPPPRPARRPSSDGCLKWGIIGCAGVLGMVVLIVFGIGWYVSSHKKDIAAAADRNVREGINAARTTDEKGCVAAAERRMQNGSVLTGGVQGAMFLEACLRSSQPTPGFCDGVPSTGDMTRSSAWQQQRCAKEAISPTGNVRCQAVGNVIQRFCTEDGRPKTDPDAALARLDSLAAARRDTLGTGR